MDGAYEVVSKGPLVPVAEPVSFHRYPAQGAAAALVRHYWLVEYSFAEGEGRDVPILVYPASNVVIEATRARLYAPSPELAVQHLEGSGVAFGALLQLATGFRIAGRPLAEFAGGSIELAHGSVVGEVRGIMIGAGDAAQRHPAAITAFERWLTTTVPALGPEDELVNAIADAVESDPALIRVDELAAHFGLSRRRLERLVARYVGLTPKWMIQRRRLQEAAARLRAEPRTELSGLAAELGYADYSHFSRDFAATVGVTPRDFLAAAVAAAGPTAPRAPARARAREPRRPGPSSPS